MPQLDSNLIIFLMIASVVVYMYMYMHTNQNNNFCSNNDIIDNNILQNHKNKHRKTKKYKHKHKYQSKKPKNKNINIEQFCDILESSKRHNNYNKHNQMTNVNVNVQKPKLNSEFIEIQYHRDYNDTITAINNLTAQKELFNLSFSPVKETVPTDDTGTELVDMFINKLNSEVAHNVSEYLHVNSGWNDMGKRKREKSGFEEQMEKLGLPGSLYNEEASKAPIKLVKIEKAVQYNTNDQIRIVVHIIIQKINVRDQMILKVQFFIERGDLLSNNDDIADFFKRELPLSNEDNIKSNIEQVVIIEQVFTVGYLTNEAGAKTKMDKFHDYDDIDVNINGQKIYGVHNQEQILNSMLQKHKDRQNELNSFKCTTDHDTQEINNIPDIDNYSVYKNTRTIMDDLAKFPRHSFGDVTV
jgi:hypothetical protein